MHFGCPEHITMLKLFTEERRGAESIRERCLFALRIKNARIDIPILSTGILCSSLASKHICAKTNK